MIAHACKNCGQITLVPLVNKFNEYFCCENCYKKYCERNNYEVHTEELKLIKNIFTD